MKITISQYTIACGCRSVDECTHNGYAEFKALDALVDTFAAKMREKLYASMIKGRSGWYDPNYTTEQIREALIKHIEKGDPVDVASFAAFWWNRL